MASNSTVLGVVLFIRHGDRQGFYQDPNTYDASNTVITPLGNAQEVALGALLRQRYLNASASNNVHIQTMDTGLVNDTQIQIRADAGDEGGVILASAVSLAQGLWPPTTAYNTTLANGTTVVGPLGGYQYIPIDGVQSSIDVSLEGFTSCGTFNNALSKFYNSTEFTQKAEQSNAFLSQLPPFLDGRPVTLQNMWNIFDFMNVESIHDAAFANALPSTFLPQARDLANWHEYNAFSDAKLDGIGNIAMRTMLPSVITGMQRIANASDPLAFQLQAISYKPFLSFFNMTGVAEANASLAGVVNYAAAVALEVRQPGSGGEAVVRFLFKNGTDDVDFNQYAMMGTTNDIPVSTFIQNLAPAAINTTAEWCTTCGNTLDRGCGALALAASQARVHQTISPVGAGFLGAGLTIVVFLAALGVMTFLGLLTLGGRKRTRKGMSEDSDRGNRSSEEKGRA